MDDTRNFALIGHAGDGKTTLGDAVLATAGAIPAAGDVKDGTSVLNHLPEERDGHTATISTHLFGFDWQGHGITLVDTPGDPNFAGDGMIALQALDGAVLVVGASEGAKVGTSKMMAVADEAGVAAVAFLSKMDQERADFDAALDSLTALDRRPVALCLPIGAGDAFEGYVDLLHQKAYGPSGEIATPDAMADLVEAKRLELVEAAAECDDELLERYLDEGALGEEELRKGLLAGVRSRQLLPVLCGSGATGLGADAVLRAATELLPSPAERGEWSARDLDGHDELTVKPDADAPLTAVVFKTIIDRYAGTLSVLRVVSGRLSPDSSVLNATTGEKTRVGKLMRMQGEKHGEVAIAGPGDVVAVAKLKGAHTGHVLTAEKGGLRLDSLRVPQGALAYAIEPKHKGDDDKVHQGLGRIVEEDPTLHLGREASTGEFLLTGLGELHIRTAVKKLQRLFDVEVELTTPKVPYRETIQRSVEHIEGKLKKQSGGKGMFGVCYLSVEPRERGEGIEFVDEIVGGAIPRGLIPAVEKGILEACESGPLAGYPVVDVRVRCVDGKHHSVDSNEMAFKLAGSFGFKAAVEQAKPMLLEPVVQVEVQTPDDHVGDVMGDLSSRRGRVQSTEARGHATTISASVPMAEMLEYASVLTSLTQGQGAFEMHVSHYDPAPAHVQQKVVAEARASGGAE